MLGLTDSQLLDLLSTYGYGMVLVVSIIEGPIVAALAGLLISLDIFNPLLATLILLLGDVLGDSLYYYVGTLFRRKKIPSWFRFFGIRDDNVHHFDHYFHKHDWKILLLGKTQAVGGAILFSAGFAKVPFGRYLWYNFLGSIPKIILLEIIGFYFGEAFSQIDKVISYVGITSFILALILLGSYWLFKRYVKSHYEEFQDE